MWRTLVAAAVVVPVLGVVPASVPVAADLPGSSPGSVSEGPAEVTTKDGSRGHGPPAWARSGKDGKKPGAKSGAKSGADDAWKERWKALTPAQREQRMKALARAHARGMVEFGKCVAAAADDPAARTACEKPLPPGHAKRQ